MKKSSHKLWLLGICAFALSGVFSSQGLCSSDGDLLEKVETKYGGASSVKMKVKKTLLLGVLKKEKISQGELFLKKQGRLRLELKTPAHSLLLIDGKKVWIVEYPPEGSDEKIRVLESKQPKKSDSQALVAFLLGNGRITSGFKVKDKKEKGDLVTLTLIPQKAKEEMSKVVLVLRSSKLEIQELTLIDALENETHFEFSDVKFGGEIDDLLFDFKIPKNSEHTHLD